MPPQPYVDHVALSVTDLDRSEPWYRRLLDVQHVTHRDGPTWRRAILQAEGFRLSLTEHDDTQPADRFDETRVGLDHIGIGCRDRAALEAWIRHVDNLDIDRGPTIEATHAHLFVCRDPDDVAIEFYSLV
jgi:glyoxylase I family protein